MRLNYNLAPGSNFRFSRRTAMAFAVFLPFTCAPTRGEVRHVAGTNTVIMHEDTYKDLEAQAAKQAAPEDTEREEMLRRISELIGDNTTLREINEILKTRNSTVEGEITSLIKALRSRDPRGRTPSYDLSNDPAFKVGRLYLHSLLVENPTYVDYSILIEMLSFQAMIKQVTDSTVIDPTTLKDQIKRNYISVNGGGGILLSTDGYFITAYHVVANSENFYVQYNGRTYNAQRIVWNPNYEVAICKIDFGPNVEFSPTNVRFARLGKIRKGANIEVFGHVGDNQYFQMGRIVNNNVESLLDGGLHVYSMVETTALSTGGFSGGPVILQDTGELVGITSYSKGMPGELGAARIDQFLEVMRWFVDKKLEQLRIIHRS